MEFNIPPKVFCLLVGQEIPGKLCLQHQHPESCRGCDQSTAQYLKILFRLIRKRCVLPEGLSPNEVCVACGTNPPKAKGLCYDCMLQSRTQCVTPFCSHCGDGPVIYGKEQLCFYCFCEKHHALFLPYVHVPIETQKFASILPTEDTGSEPLCDYCHKRAIRRTGGRAERICNACYRRRRRALLKVGLWPRHLCPKCKKRPVMGKSSTKQCHTCYMNDWRKRKRAAKKAQLEKETSHGEDRGTEMGETTVRRES